MTPDGSPPTLREVEAAVAAAIAAALTVKLKPATTSAELPEKLLSVFAKPNGKPRTHAEDGRPVRYRALYGGRGGAKSWGVARILIGYANAQFERILCCREFQSSIADSVHKLLVDQIDAMGLANRFDVTEHTITNRATGAQFIFKGLRKNIREIKSLEGVTKVWVEEAQAVSKQSWQILRPTIRAPGSEIWATFNPEGEEDPTYQLFVVHPPPGCVALKIGYQDNPWFPAELEAERQADLASGDTDAYQWIWEGDCLKISDAIIFKRRVFVQTFEEPQGTIPRFGADWGFANDPAALIRFYITEEPSEANPRTPDQILWITHEAFGYQVEIDDLPEMFEGKTENGATSKRFVGVPGARDWPIKADSARPEIISYIRRRGFNIAAAEKWPGSVEDGVDHLKGFKRIMVHPRCEHIAREFRLYAYKVDPLDKTTILPVIVDKWNHGIDAVRYGLDGVIQHRGGMGVWRRLSK